MKNLFLLAMTCIAFCGAREAMAATRICVLLPTQREERWRRDRQAFLELARERRDAEVVLEISDNSSDSQAAQLDGLLARKCRGFVVAPHDHEKMRQKLDSLPASAPPVVAYDRFVASSRVALYVSYDPRAVGRLQGEFLATRARPGDLLVLRGPASDDNARHLHDGAMASLAAPLREKRLRVVLEREIPDWNPAMAQIATRDAWKASNGTLSAVLAPNDALAAGVVEMLKSFGAAGKVMVTGQDADEEALHRLRLGTQAMTVEKPIGPLVRAALDAALELAEGKTPKARGAWGERGVTVPAILLPPLLRVNP